MSTLLEAAANGWSWKTGEPVAIIAQNAFGNLIIRTEHGWYYRIVPEDPKCTLLGTDLEEMQSEIEKEDFKRDWEMRVLVGQAETALGKLAEGQSYHLVIPGILGGGYSIGNIKKISTTELLEFSGDVARQIDHLPDGTKVRCKWI